ncbi:hypothetical protein HJG60_011928 [Phyllostomus discolor]|uniref:Uncharacterized protein n=1 Tax=Phyllostomus discolor TaxID=89673 RepID=A0A833ZEB3_9CHIR|nr:hypothetical protein HJG60_011928 [Phyllostomus discolor]
MCAGIMAGTLPACYSSFSTQDCPNPPGASLLPVHGQAPSSHTPGSCLALEPPTPPPPGTQRHLRQCLQRPGVQSQRQDMLLGHCLGGTAECLASTRFMPVTPAYCDSEECLQKPQERFRAVKLFCMMLEW